MDRGLEIMELLGVQPGESVLEAGCGLGGLAAALHQAGAVVTAIDHDPVVLEQARLAAPAVRFVESDILAFESEAPFDAVVSQGTLHWVKPPGAATERLFELLRPGGRLVAEWGGVPAGLIELCWLPTAGQLGMTLEAAGFDVRLIAAYDAGAGRSRRLQVLAYRPAEERL